MFCFRRSPALDGQSAGRVIVFRAAKASALSDHVAGPYAVADPSCVTLNLLAEG